MSAKRAWQRIDPRKVSKSLSPLSEEELRTTAYHEAGHAVVAYVLLNVLSDSLSITDAMENTGVTKIRFNESLRKNLGYIKKWIIVCAAGAKAEEIFTTRPQPLDHDRENAACRLAEVNIVGEEATYEMKKASDKAGEVLHKHWSAVQALAEDLLKHYQLSREQIESILTDSGVR